MESKRKANGANNAADTNDDRASKRRRMPEEPDFDLSLGETPESTTHYGLLFTQMVRDTKDKSGRLVATNFLTLPNRKELPDYYEFTKLPIAIDTIEAKLKRKEFPTLTTLESYFKRMVQNAKEYNERGSEIFDDAERLRKVLVNFMTKTNPAYDTPGYVPFPTPLPSESKGNDHAEEETAEASAEETEDLPKRGRSRHARSASALQRKSATPAVAEKETSSTGFKGLTFQKAQEKIVSDLITDRTDPSDEFATFEVFLNLPPRTLKDYYQLIQHPLGLKKLQKRVLGVHGRNDVSGTTDFRSWAAFEDTASLIWKNAWEYNEDGSDISNLAKDLEKAFTKLVNEAKKEVAEPVAPKIKLKLGEPEPPPKIMLKLGHRTSTNSPAPAPNAQKEVPAVNGANGAATPAASERVQQDTPQPSVPVQGLTAPIGLKEEDAPNAPPLQQLRPGSSAGMAPGISPLQGLGRPQGTAIAPPGNAAPLPVYNPLTSFTSRFRAEGKNPRLSIARHLRMSIAPDDKLSQQTATLLLPSTHYFLHVRPELPASLMDRQYKMFVTSGNQRLQALPAVPGQPLDKRRPNFEVRLLPGLNRIEVELIAALPRGAPKLANGQDVELEKITIYANLQKD